MLHRNLLQICLNMNPTRRCRVQRDSDLAVAEATATVLEVDRTRSEPTFPFQVFKYSITFQWILKETWFTFSSRWMCKQGDSHLYWLKTHILVWPSTTQFAQQTLHFTWPTPTKAASILKRRVKSRRALAHMHAKTASSFSTSTVQIKFHIMGNLSDL